MKKTTAIKQFRFISPQCPSLGQSTVPDGEVNAAASVSTGSVAAGPPTSPGFTELAVKTMLSAKL